MFSKAEWATGIGAAPAGGGAAALAEETPIAATTTAAAAITAIQGPRLEVVFMNRSEITVLRSPGARVTGDYDRIIYAMIEPSA